MPFYRMNATKDSGCQHVKWINFNKTEIFVVRQRDPLS